MPTFPPALANAPQLYIRQEKEWAEIIVDWETVNRYTVLSPTQETVALFAERGGGLWDTVKRVLLRSHRPLHVDLFDAGGTPLLELVRDFFWFWSDLQVREPSGSPWGSVHRRFSVFYKVYDLRDQHGRVFARIEAPFWRLWTFPVQGSDGRRNGQISKKWSGLLREAFSDADTFLVDMTAASWTREERAVILAAAISIDFDFFEENEGVSSLLSLGD